MELYLPCHSLTLFVFQYEPCVVIEKHKKESVTGLEGRKRGSYISLLYGYSMILLYNHSLILLYKIEQTKLSLLY